ncbi:MULTISPECIES: DUF6286 domain-containing protein [Frankia]|uniref:DUF6286 domain-containing protein n=1 Tax=Frankia alni (strain DSM 45986 / CECT 9034 / ACN14a) TaxID=326424 RepID=Q0RCD3_FRAAA|nr:MULTISPECIES: DUF6286 domain-containing protein [Frankia]CAJ64893.1 hypothetical protein; putative signal peptide [Frankia alni ACN14a]
MGRRVVAGLLATLIAVAGVIAVVEIIAAAVGEGQVLINWRSWANGLSDTAWSRGPALLAAGFVALVGLLLIGIALRSGTPARLRTRWGCPRAGVFVDRRGLARDLRATALAVDGVDRARVRVHRRVADVRLRLRPRVAGDTPRRVAAVLSEELDAFALVESPDLTIRATSTGRRHEPAAVDGPARHDGPAGWGGPGGHAGPSGGDGRPASGGADESGGADGSRRAVGTGPDGTRRVGAAARRGGEAP